MKRRWVVALIGVVILALAFALFRQSPDEFDYLRPYVTSDRISYAEFKVPAGESQFWKSRTVEVDGKPITYFVEQTRAKFPSSDGWRDVIATGQYLGKYSPAGEMTDVVVIEGGTGSMTVTRSHRMSKSEVIWARIRHPGRDIFEEADFFGP